MTTVDALTLADANRIVREALKDRAYRATPLGSVVARYLDWKETEWGATKDTIRDYESVLRRTSIYFSDLSDPMTALEPPDGTGLLRECWAHWWREAEGRTKAKVRSVWVDFFEWCNDESLMRGNPARRLRAPKKRDVKRDPFESSWVAQVLATPRYPADSLGVRLVLQYGLRRAELAGVTFGDFDFRRRQVAVTGKGGKVRYSPIVEPQFWDDLRAVMLSLNLDLEPHPEWFLVCKRRHFYHGTRYYHATGYKPRSMHNWWYDRLEESGIVGDRDSGTRHGQFMHRGRHTVATELLIEGGSIVAAKELLGHSDIRTTSDAYAKFDTADLEAVLAGIRLPNREAN